MAVNAYPPAEQIPSATRSSTVVGKMLVNTDADNPAAPNPPNVLSTCTTQSPTVTTALHP